MFHGCQAIFLSFVLVYLVYINLDGCPIGKYIEPYSQAILSTFWLSHHRDHGRVLSFQ